VIIDDNPAGRKDNNRLEEGINQGQPTKDPKFNGVRSTREMMLNKNYSHGPA
jgi:hypothetical protein